MPEPAQSPSDITVIADTGFSRTRPASGVVHFLREGLQIARWDVEAVERVAREPKALVVGACFMILATLLSGVPALIEQPSDAPSWPFVTLGPLVVAFGQLGLSALATGVIHGAAKVLFGASGRYVAVLRVLWVGSVVLWLGAVPVVGALVANVLYLLVALVAISEVEGVERLQALILVVGLRALILLAGLLAA